MTGPAEAGSAARELPNEFPIFPLTGALLLPRGRLPLNIFEPRYLAMTEDAMSAGRFIGMIQPNPALPRGPTGPGLHHVGCLGRIVSFAETDDGRYLITLAGVCRFRVAEELPLLRGYRRVAADFTGFEADIAVTEPEPALDRTILFGLLRAYFDKQGAEVHWQALETMADTVLVATLSMACPFEPMEKQALLEAEDVAARLGILSALLQFDTVGGTPPAKPS